MARTLSKNSSVAWLPEGHPDASAGPGYYEVLKDNENDQELNENGDSINVTLTNTEVEYGERLVWQKNNPDPEGEPADPENNEGKFVYASSLSDEEVPPSENGNQGE